MPVIATDNFNRANGAPGANWTAVKNALTITSNTIAANALADDVLMYWSANSFPATQYAELTLSVVGAGARVGPAVRVSSGPTGIFMSALSTNIVIRKVLSGTFSNLTTVTVTVAAGDILRAEANGSEFVFYRNGSPIYSTQITDAALQTGSSGIGGFGNDLSTTGDTWEGGEISSTSQQQLRIARAGMDNR